MRVAEVERARRRGADPLWPWVRPTSAAEQLAEGPHDWTGAGAVTVTDAHLVFADDDRQRRTSLRTVRAAERVGAVLWVRRRNAHDWLVRFEREGDARRVEVALRRAVAERR